MRRTYFALIFLFLGACQATRPTPEEALRAKLDSVLTRVCQVYDLPGLAVGVIKGDQVVYARGFGLRKLGTSDSVSSQSSFHMASVSKSFVAMAILQLVEKGQVSLDSPLVRYIPYFTMADHRYTKITVRQMLTHTSGFPDIKDYGWDKPQYDDGALERYIRDSVSHCTLLSDPGIKFAYSNMAYDVLAGVVAAVSGTTFETYMKMHLFDPCKMRNSTFTVKDVLPGLATSPHVLGNSCHFEVSDVYPYNRCHAGSSTLHSNVEDMLDWELMILRGGEGVLSPGSLTMMLTPQFKFDSNSAVGLGLFIDTWNHKKLVSHSGSDVGYSCYVGMIPEDSVGIVFMSNLHRFVPYETLTYLLISTIYDYPFPEPRKPITSVITPLICTEGFEKARQTYFRLKKDSAAAYDFNADWLNALEFSYRRLGNLRVADQVHELYAGNN
ncbi:MAG TPA: serine hydrolase domain-containing protein, partial [Puia sp.]